MSFELLRCAECGTWYAGWAGYAPRDCTCSYGRAFLLDMERIVLRYLKARPAPPGTIYDPDQECLTDLALNIDYEKHPWLCTACQTWVADMAHHGPDECERNRANK